MYQRFAPIPVRRETTDPQPASQPLQSPGWCRLWPGTVGTNLAGIAGREEEGGSLPKEPPPPKAVEAQIGWGGSRRAEPVT